MGFIHSYKRLEKLCNEIYGNNRGVSAYIDEMVRLTSASRYIFSWDSDLKQLKHYRWIRNQIAHEPNCTEENMCKYGDAEWLDGFHLRIMSGNDPLTLYRKAQNTQTVQRPKQPKPSEYIPPKQECSSSKPVGCLIGLVGILLIVAVIVLVVTTLH